MKILIWQARSAKGMSLRELANQTGISKSTLNNLENGKQIPNLRHIELIAKVLEVSMSSLYDSDYK